MTIETTVNKTIQSGNGSNKDFDFAFEIPDEDSLSLTKRGSDGTETAITTNFTVTGIGDEAGGTVNYPTSGSALASNEKIIIKRVVALKQPENLRNQGDYSLEDIEDALDRAVMLCQQLQEQIDRCVVLNITSSQSGIKLDDLVSNRLLVASADGQSIEMSSAEYGSIDAYLSTLAAIAANIPVVAAIDTEVTTVAGISADVTTVAGIAAAVTSVAAIAANISTVAGISANVTTVAGMESSIASVVANMASILNAASFGFPTATGADVGKFLKLNASFDGYDFVNGDNLAALAGLTGAADKLPYFTEAGAMALQDRLATISNKGVSYLPKQITIANNSTDTEHDLNFTAGNAQADDGSLVFSVGALTKQIDATWVAGTNQGGLDTGTVANNTPYYIFAIYNPTTSVSDILFSASKTSPTLPSGFTKKEYKGACHTDGSANIRNGKWVYDTKGSVYIFKYDTPVKDIDETVPATTVQTKTISAPAGSFPIMPVYYGSTGTGGGDRYLIFTEVGSTDLTPSLSTFDMRINQGAVEAENDSAPIDYIQLSASSQLRYRSNTTASIVTECTRGWKEYL